MAKKTAAASTTTSKTAARKRGTSSPAKATPAKAKRAARLNQSDVPAHTLTGALRVAEALRDDWAKKSAAPLDLAASLNQSPTGSSFRMLTGAAMAYGLTEGAAQSAQITLTELGQRCVAPLTEGDDAVAMREAVLKPRVIREFLEKYDNNGLPQKTIALNVLESLGVPGAAADRAYEMIVDNAQALGLLLDIKGKKYVKLNAPAATPTQQPSEVEPPLDAAQLYAPDDDDDSYRLSEAPELPTKPPTDPQTNNRVFITHGRNATVVEQIKKILTYGKFEPVVSAQLQTVAKPVPDKVMDDMRSCSAAIVHVGIERVLLDESGEQHPQINSNVLIEIGAAMALYNRRFVLLVERGVSLPSNLQGLYEVRYEGEQLEFDATMKLLEVFSTF
jgi:hypothetical protein